MTHKRSVIWESADVNPSASFKWRPIQKYASLYKKIKRLDITDETLVTYKKEDTKLDYDVIFKYKKKTKDDIIPYDYIILFYSTDYMMIDSTTYNYIEMIRYPVLDLTKDSSLKVSTGYNEYYISAAKIRSNAGHVLDKFFGDVIDPYWRYSTEIDPLDGIANFEENKDFVNGGCYYFNAGINNYVWDLLDDKNLSRSLINVYQNDDILYNIADLKIQELMDAWFVLGEPDYNKNYKLWQDGIIKFFNDDCGHHKNNVRFIWKGIEIIFKEEKKWDRQENRWSYKKELNIKDMISGKINSWFPEQNLNGKIVYVFKRDIEKFINTFDDYFLMIFRINYITKQKDNSFDYFFDNLVNGIPKRYVESLINILNEDGIKDKNRTKRTDIYIGILNVILNPKFRIYSECLYPLLDYFLSFIENNQYVYTIFEYMKNIPVIFKNINDLTYTPRANYLDNGYNNFFISHHDDIYRAIQLVYSLKVTHEKNHTDRLCRVISRLLKGAFISKDLPEWHQKNQKSLWNYKVEMVCGIITKLASIDTDLLPYNINGSLEYNNVFLDTKKIIIPEKEYTDPITGIKEIIPESFEYVNVQHTQSYNYLNSINLLINRIIKKPSEKDKYEKAIGITNSFNRSNVQDDILKTLSFFLLNADRLNAEPLNRIKELIDNMYQHPYSTVCSIRLEKTMLFAVIIQNVLPLCWKGVITLAHIDHLFELMEPFTNCQVWADNIALYDTARDNMVAYLQSI